MINVVGRSNTVGLDRDRDLVVETLREAGLDVTFSHYRSRSVVAAPMLRRPRYRATIFLERVFLRWLGTAAVDLLIPNQERFPRRHVRRLRHIDRVLCKTRHAESIFSGLGCAAAYVGFTSRDRRQRAVDRIPKAVLHLAGRSTLKGTEAVLRLWRKHPEWPELVVIRHDGHTLEGSANIRVVHEYLDDDELRRLQNRCAIHVCPSLAEGWGHALVEGLSCGAIVLTTDAPPMNEVVGPDRGIRIPYTKTSPRHLGTCYFVDEVQLERAVERALSWPPSARRAMSARARHWFEDNDRRFRRRLVEVVDDVLKRTPDLQTAGG